MNIFNNLKTLFNRCLTFISKPDNFTIKESLNLKDINLWINNSFNIKTTINALSNSTYFTVIPDNAGCPEFIIRTSDHLTKQNCADLYIIKTISSDDWLMLDTNTGRNIPIIVKDCDVKQYIKFWTIMYEQQWLHTHKNRVIPIINSNSDGVTAQTELPSNSLMVDSTLISDEDIDSYIYQGDQFVVPTKTVVKQFIGHLQLNPEQIGTSAIYIYKELENYSSKLNLQIGNLREEYKKFCKNYVNVRPLPQVNNIQMPSNLDAVYLVRENPEVLSHLLNDKDMMLLYDPTLILEPKKWSYIRHNYLEHIFKWCKNFTSVITGPRKKDDTCMMSMIQNVRIDELVAAFNFYGYVNSTKAPSSELLHAIQAWFGTYRAAKMYFIKMWLCKHPEIVDTINSMKLDKSLYRNDVCLYPSAYSPLIEANNIITVNAEDTDLTEPEPLAIHPADNIPVEQKETPIPVHNGVSNEVPYRSLMATIIPQEPNPINNTPVDLDEEQNTDVEDIPVVCSEIALTMREERERKIEELRIRLAEKETPKADDIIDEPIVHKVIKEKRIKKTNNANTDVNMQEIYPMTTYDKVLDTSAGRQTHFDMLLASLSTYTNFFNALSNKNRTVLINSVISSNKKYDEIIKIINEPNKTSLNPAEIKKICVKLQG